MAVLTSPIVRRPLTVAAIAARCCGCGHAAINMARSAPAARAGTVHVLVRHDDAPGMSADTSHPAPGGSVPMIRRCDGRDLESIWAIINDGAQAYRGIIPADRWTEPYMSREKLRREIDEGVVFWGYEEAGTLAGVMGLQRVQDVTLIRHAYVRSNSQKRGIGAHLLSHLREMASGPVLIGTWADAVWAIRFYERYGFRVVGPEEKDRLLKQYWTIPERQIETSVVLADPTWRDALPTGV